MSAGRPAKGCLHRQPGVLSYAPTGHVAAYVQRGTASFSALSTGRHHAGARQYYCPQLRAAWYADSASYIHAWDILFTPIVRSGSPQWVACGCNEAATALRSSRCQFTDARVTLLKTSKRNGIVYVPGTAERYSPLVRLVRARPQPARTPTMWDGAEKGPPCSHSTPGCAVEGKERRGKGKYRRPPTMLDQLRYRRKISKGAKRYQGLWW